MRRTSRLAPLAPCQGILREDISKRRQTDVSEATLKTPTSKQTMATIVVTAAPVPTPVATATGVKAVMGKCQALTKKTKGQCSRDATTTVDDQHLCKQHADLKYTPEKHTEAAVKEFYVKGRGFIAMKEAAEAAKKEYEAMTAEQRTEQKKEWEKAQETKRKEAEEAAKKEEEEKVPKKCGGKADCNGHVVKGYVHPDGSYRCSAHDGRKPKKETGTATA